MSTTVEQLIEHLKTLPSDAKILVSVGEFVGFSQTVNFVDLDLDYDDGNTKLVKCDGSDVLFLGED